MTKLHRHPRPAAALLAVLCASAAFAGTVTVNATTRAGTAAEDTVIVFDPLDAAPPASRNEAIIDQVNKKFVPRVSVVRTGTTITFPNSDRIRHQVYSFSRTKTFDLKLYAGSPKTPVIFDQPGLVVLGCNIHDSMVAFVGVVDSPYFAKTTDSGAVSLNLPPGRYRLRAWNPNAVAAIPAREVTVAAAPLSIPVSLDLDPASAAPAAWPE
ncbi:MAG TPA: methylamine utilization protein [Steroidobacteraceae bacterium]|nr:methylamine utilization protein [Steroidobacteraceae bacterium]